MSFDGTDYFTLAEELTRQAKNSPVEEAMLRSAISRAYYAVFLKARHHLRVKEKDTLIPGGPAAHEYIKDKFKNSSSAVRQEIGEALKTLRIQRNRADYGDNFPALFNSTQLVLFSARDALDALDRLPSTSS